MDIIASVSPAKDILHSITMQEIDKHSKTKHLNTEAHSATIQAPTLLYSTYVQLIATILQTLGPRIAPS